jgi:hypothetical protein
MNRSLSASLRKGLPADAVTSVFKHLTIPGTLALLTTISALAQNAELQERFAAVKQAAAESKQRLRQYQWIETTQLTLKGDQKPPSKICANAAPTIRSQKLLSVLPRSSPVAAG